MKSRKIFPRLTPLVLAALLLNSTPGAAAQRRRRPARTHARTAAPAPQPTTTTQAAPTPSQATPQTTQTSLTPTTPQPSPARADTPPRNSVPERTIEEMLSADGYGVYAEVRRVGVLARSEELKSAVGLLGLVGPEETQPLTDLFNFLSDNAEALAEARAVAAFMPTRAGLPQALVALELPTPEAAAAFEPKFRRVVGQQYETVENVLSGQPGPRAQGTLKATTREANDRAATRDAVDKAAGAEADEKGAAREKAEKGTARDATEKGASGATEKGANVAAGEKNVGGAAEKPAAKGAEKSAGSQGVVFRRVGRLLLAAESPFTLGRLRGEEGTPALSENARFQSVRIRFASDSVFVYVDTTLAQQGYAVEQQRQQEARDAAAKQAAEQYGATVGVARKAEEQTAAQPSASASPDATPALIATTAPTPTTPTRTTATPASTPTTTGSTTTTTDEPPAPPASPAPSPTSTTQETNPSQPAPTPERPTDEDKDAEANSGAGAAVVASGGAVRPSAIAVTAPSEEQVTVQRMVGVMGNLFEGAPRIPGAVALGLSLDSGALAVRVAVENTPDGVVSLIPFVPNLVAGPPVTAEAAQVAPADADIFLTTSFDWTQIYNATLGTASLNPQRLVTSWEETDDGDASVFKPRPGEKAPTAEEAVAAVEKLFGFSFKEDLLPALGNEVALSATLDTFVGGSTFGRPAEKKEEKDAEPGTVVIVSLNNPDKIREILPRVLAALGFVAPGAQLPPPEKREGFEIRSLGTHLGLSYAVIDNFLVLSEDFKAIRYVVDSYAARRTLAAEETFRDSTSWQARQKLGELYVSESLMRSTVESTKRDSGGSTDPVVRALLARLDEEPRPASYEVTNEGDVLVHELRLPLSLIRVYALTTLISLKDAPVIANERMAAYALNRIADAQTSFKEEKKKGRYGTLEELFAEKLLEQDFFTHLEYKLELSAAGDKFDATATPKSYGKTGRRSFFVNETGTVRGADHHGEHASADDPPVN